MGCGGQREKGPPEQSQKWAYLSLEDFKSSSSWNTLAYMWLWLMSFVTVAVYAADTYTAVNLLAFNNWTMKIQPALDIKYSRWIFAGCILLSWALAIVEWIRAIRVIRRGGVAESYMDPLAVSLQCMRSKGWRRFLVFTSLTKSKKGVDYIAFFVYFAFKGAIRVILAEGPRQVINGMTLYAVMKADLFDTPDLDHSAIEQFWNNLQTLFEDSELQAMTMVTMLFTLAIWVVSALSLISAVVLYLVFLWHYIPQSDGRLSIYCRRKIDHRLEKIVESTVQAAVEEEERSKRKAEEKAQLQRKKTGDLPPPTAPQLARQPTLPQIGATPEMKSDDKMPEFSLNRQNTSTTVSTLPPYTSRPPTRNENARLERQPTLPDYSSMRPPPSRINTQASGWSNTSYESDAPLLANAGYAGEAGQGMSAPARPPTAFSRQNSDVSFGRPAPNRTMTQGSQGPQRSYAPMSRMESQGPPRSYTPVSRTNTSQSRQPVGPRMPIRTNTGMSFDQEPRSAIAPMSSDDDFYGRPQGPPMRQNTPGAPDNGMYGRPQGPPRRNTPDAFGPDPFRQGSPASFNRPAPALSRQQTFGSFHSQSSSFSRPIPPIQRRPSQQDYRPFSPPSAHDEPPAPLRHADSYEMTPQRTYTPVQTASPVDNQSASGGYVAFNPGMRSASSTPTPSQSLQRSATAQDGFFGRAPIHVPQRSATAPITEHRGTIGYSDIVDDYSSADPTPPPPQPYRPGSAGAQETHQQPHF